MTLITVTTPSGRLDGVQKAQLAETLTDAVLRPELGQMVPAARIGFQVQFIELALDSMAIGGALLSGQAEMPDVMTVEIAVMDGDWTAPVRAEVIEGTLQALADACGLPTPAPAWWVLFRVVPEGSWGSRGGVLSILDLLGTGVFTPEKAAAIRDHLVSEKVEKGIANKCNVVVENGNPASATGGPSKRPVACIIR